MRVNTLIALLPALAGLAPLATLADDFRPAAGGGSPGGSSLQLQYNNSGAFGGMAGSSWNAATQQLSLAEAPSITWGAAGVTFTKGAGSSAVLDLTADYSGKVLRILLPPDQATFSPVTYIGNGGEIKTRAWMTISGSTSGSYDTYVINDPLDSSYKTMANVWADVPYTLVLRTFNANGGFNIAALDRSANFRFMMPEDGSLTWGPSTASTPSGIDTGISRAGAASLTLGNGTSGDYSGALKLTKLTLADGTSSLSAANLTFAGDTFITRAAAANIRFGGADAASPVAQTISFQGALAGTSNAAGADAYLKASAGTGTGAGGKIHVQAAASGASGSTQNTYADVMVIASNGVTFNQNLSLNYAGITTNGGTFQTLAGAPGTGGAFAWSNGTALFSTGSGAFYFENNGNSAYFSLSTLGAGVAALGNGTSGDYSGTLKLTGVVTAALTYATLPASPTAGQRAFITNANTNSFGATVSGAGSYAVAVLYNGTSWVVD